MTLLFVAIAFLCGAGFGAMVMAGLMLGIAVNRQDRATPETLIDGRRT